jgi:hypothetical protein
VRKAVEQEKGQWRARDVGRRLRKEEVLYKSGRRVGCPAWQKAHWKHREGEVKAIQKEETERSPSGREKVEV